jgi:hypothetical protein
MATATRGQPGGGRSRDGATAAREWSVLAFTHSGKEGVNEGCGFDVAADHGVTWKHSLDIRRAPE